jgi:hypothetical protein
MYLLLARVPDDQQIQVWDKGQGALGAKRLGKLIEVDAERMIAKLEFRGSDYSVVAHVPLAFVTAVWLDEKDVSNIDVRGAFNIAKYSNGPPFVPFGSVA